MAGWRRSGALPPGTGLAVGQKVNVNVSQSFGGALEKGEIIGITSSGYRVRLVGGKEVEVAARFVKVDHYANTSSFQNGRARAEREIAARMENAGFTPSPELVSAWKDYRFPGFGGGGRGRSGALAKTRVDDLLKAAGVTGSQQYLEAQKALDRAVGY